MNMSVEQGDDIAVSKVAPDGLVSVSKKNNKLQTVTFTVMQGSQAQTVLGELLDAQEKQVEGPILRRTVFAKNPLTGEECYDNKAYFSARPNLGQEEETGEREFTMVLPYGADNYVYGNS